MDLDSEGAFSGNYEVKLAAACEKCYDQDTIVFLPPGDSKSFVSAAVLQHMAAELSGNKKFLFYICVSGFSVDQKYKLYGANDFLKVSKFESQPQDDPAAFKLMMKESDVWMVTADQVQNALTVGVIDWNCCAMVIFDDCMHCGTSSHPFGYVMDMIHDAKHEGADIRVLGLTVSGFAGKLPANELEMKLSKLCEVMKCTVVTPDGVIKEYFHMFRAQEMCILYEELDIEDWPEAKQLRQLIYMDIVTQNSRIEPYKSVLFAVTRVLDVFHILGPYSSFEVVSHFSEVFIDIVGNKNYSEPHTIFINSAISAFLAFSVSLGNNLTKLFSLDDVLEHVNNSVLKLIQVLSGFYNENRSKFSALIFVRSRTTAIALLSLMNLISKDCKYKFIRAGCALGDSNTSAMDMPSSTSSDLSTTITNFCAGNINVVIATEGLEEVLDLRSCGLVVSMEAPTTFASYLHSRGQARGCGQRATYAVMISVIDADSKFSALHNYKCSESFLMKYLESSETEDDCIFSKTEDDCLVPARHLLHTFETCVGAKVNLGSALNVLSRYCSRLPSDVFVMLVPTIRTKRLGIFFYSTLYLPINSPVRCPITSDAATSIKRSEKQAALKAVKILHAAGELDDNLNPVTKDDISVDELMDEFDDQLSGDKRLGTTQQRRLYLRKVPSMVKNGMPRPNVPVYVYVIEMDLIQPISPEKNPKRREILNPIQGNHLFGFCSSSNFGAVPPFSVYQRQGKMRVRILRQKESVVFSTEEFQVLCDFHAMVFRDVLGFGNREDKMGFNLENSPNPLLVVPLYKQNGVFKVGVDIARKAIEGFPPSPTEAEHKQFVYKPDIYKNAVVRPWYQNEKKYNFYVGKVETDIFPTSKFSKKYGTYEAYFSEKYDVKILFDDVPLLDVDNAFKSSNLLLPPHRNQRPPTTMFYMVPELVVIHPMSAEYWLMAVQLPTVFYRLNGLLLADEFRHMVLVETEPASQEVPDDFKWTTLDSAIQSPTKDDEPANDFEPVISNNENTLIDKQLLNRVLAPELSQNMKSWFENERTRQTAYGVPPTLILQALTAASAADGFNLERFETIGDSFLKFSTSKHIFHEHAEMHEGRMTDLRSRYVSNAELFKLAYRRDIPGMMQVVTLDPMTNFLPPGFESRTCEAVVEKAIEVNDDTHDECEMQDIDEDTEVIILDKKKVPDAGYNYFTQQRISDKSVADCVEALIGVHLISRGMDDTIKFMRFMSINVDTQKRAQPPIYYGCLGEARDLIVVEDAKKYVQFKYDKTGFHRIEEKIGYFFKDRSYLIQALTHASYVDNRYTGCYQRLEFLGDAVLDYLVTRCLFELNSEFTPGVLTDLRSALVNNVIFASLAVKYDLNKCLLFESHELYESIERFVKWQRENGEVNFDDQLLSSEDCDTGSMDIEVPKALGDIFESLAGAVFLDCGMNLEVVWRVFYALMEQRIKNCIANPPKSPTRQLFEMTQYNPIFSKVERKVKLGIAEVTLEINDGKYTFVGSGKSFKTAKASASKKALAFIRQLQADANSPPTARLRAHVSPSPNIPKKQRTTEKTDEIPLVQNQPVERRKRAWSCL